VGGEKQQNGNNITTAIETFWKISGTAINLGKGVVDWQERGIVFE